VFTTADKFEVPVEIANFGAATLTNVPTGWMIVDSSNHVVANGSLVHKPFRLGKIWRSEQFPPICPNCRAGGLQINCRSAKSTVRQRLELLAVSGADV